MVLSVKILFYARGELQNCFPYEEIQITGAEEPLKLSDITSGEDFGLEKDDFKGVAGMVLAYGKPMLLSWNINCPVSATDSSTRNTKKGTGYFPTLCSCYSLYLQQMKGELYEKFYKAAICL